MTPREKIGQTIVLSAVCAMLALIPLVYLSGVYEYTLLPKRFVLYLGTGFAVLGWAIKTDWGRNIRPISSPIILPIMLFSAWATLQLFNTTHVLDSLVEIVYLLTLIALFFVTAQTFSGADLQPILWTTTLTGIVIGLIGILQYRNLAFVDIPTNGLPGATFGYRNFAAMYLEAAIPIAILHFVISKARATRLFAWASVFFMGLFLIYTRTRAAWAGVAAAGLMFLVMLSNKDFLNRIRKVLNHRLRRSHIVLICCGLAGLIVMAPLKPKFRDTGLQRFDEKKADILATVSSTFAKNGDRGRLQMWRNTLNMIADHPVFGVGPGGWKRIYPAYDRGAMIRRDSAPVRPHNDYLWIASEYGLPGLGLCIWFFWAVFRSLAKLSRGESPMPLAAPLLAASLLAVFGDACFSFPKEQPQAMMYIFWICGFVAACTGQKQKRLPPIIARALLIGLLVLSTGATVLAWCQIQFDRHYFNALLAEQNDDWSTALAEVNEGLAYGSFRTHMWVLKGRAEERRGHYDLAEAAYLHALRNAPYSWQAHNGLGIVYKRQNRFAEAMHHYQEALEFFPGNDNDSAVDIRTNLGALYKSMGDETHAEQIYRSILKADPENAGANNNMGNIYKSRGQIDSAQVAYQAALRTDSTLVQAHFNLSDLYLRQKRPSEALGHAQAAARIQPDNAPIEWNLGRVLAANDRIGDAIDAYRRAIKIDRAFAQAHFNLGDLLFGLKRYKEAQAAFHDFIKTWTGDAAFVQFAQDRIRLCQTYARRQEAMKKK